MPARLRPTAPIAADAILVGDPGRALMLAQELLEQPKMSNHARGLWGYTGRTPAGAELSLQATGIGGPSATLVLADLTELGVRRAIRVGTCTAIAPDLGVGQLLVVAEARAWGGLGGGGGAEALPDEELRRRLQDRLGVEARNAIVASLDVLHGGGSPAPVSAGEAVDMQTAPLLWRGRELGVAVAALLIVTESAAGERLDAEAEAEAGKRAGVAAAAVLST
jgi:purine-nucleoside phosphorylase